MTNNDLRRKLLAWLLEEEAVILVSFLVDGVDLPGGVCPHSGGVLSLNVGWNLANPIGDLTLGEEHLSGVFSFNREPHHVRIPWGNIVTYSLMDAEFTPIPLQSVMFLIDAMAEIQAEEESPPPPTRHLKSVN